MLFKGSAVALVTPFDENNEVNYYELKNLISYQLASGTKAIVVLGTTGEASTISMAEREKIIRFAVCEINHKVPLIVGTGSNSTETAITLTRQAEELGADGVLVVSPYYNKCNDDGIFKHYKAISRQTKLPIIIYNVPSRTGVNISPKTVLKLSKIKNIVGIKEASGNLSQVAEICKFAPKNFMVYSGDDLLALPMMSIGASGVISVTANCHPEPMQMMCNYALCGDFFNAKLLHERLFEINKALFLDINPICVKYYLYLLGFNVGRPRLPLTAPNKEIKQRLKEVKNKYEN